MRLRALLILCGGLSACSSAPLGGVRATVRFLDTDAACARVFVTNGSGLSRSSGPVKRGTRDRVVGVAQDEYTGQTVSLQAKGYLADDCSGNPIDESKVEERTFASGELSSAVLLVLKGGASPDAGGTGGGGGSGGAGGGGGAAGGGGAGGGSSGTDGGPDAGTPEQCGNGADEDGDSKIDCFDPDCLLQDCNFGRRCTTLGVCEVPKKEMVCNDGLDDDGDTEIDCLDPDCATRPCADALACTYYETCQAKVCTPSLTLTCLTPPECQQGAGTCTADAGCSYAAKANSTPCDGGTCMNGECQLAFPYAPSNGVNATLPASAISPRILLDCGVSTFNSDTLAFGNWCPGQAKPAPQLVNRLGVQNLIVLPMAGLEIKDELKLTGSNPVVLLVFGDVLITGKLNVNAAGATSGGGGPASNCFLQGDPGFTFIYSGGGGGGAGFAQAGTKGGNSNGNLLAGGPAGGTYAVLPNVTLRGGCAGGDGASGVMGQQAAPGGGAGGAVQISASGTLTVDGFVMANGGGGKGGVTFNAGGGGAGSGGGLLLEANLLSLTGNAKVTAHGGGGGGGARDNDDGTDGEDGHFDNLTAAQGGMKGGGQAGNGANGGAVGAPSAAQDGTTSAGGGGGGGAGRIHLRSILTCTASGGRLVSPAPTGNCP